MAPTLVASHANGDTPTLSQESGADVLGCGPGEDCLADEILGERELSKLRWRSRRGLLENDLLIEKFFSKYSATLTVAQAKGMSDLMDLSDNDLLDLLLRRKEPADLTDLDAKSSASTFNALLVLNLLRPGGAP